LRGTLYSDTHNGAAPPSDPTVTRAGERSAVEAGRIVLNEKAGNLTGDQAKQLGSQLATIQQQIAADTQANGGSLSATDAQAINQLQNQLSQQIYEAAHGSATTA
jgi:predicted transcriptional regulator